MNKLTDVLRNDRPEPLLFACDYELRRKYKANMDLNTWMDIAIHTESVIRNYTGQLKGRA